MKVRYLAKVLKEYPKQFLVTVSILMGAVLTLFLYPTDPGVSYEVSVQVPALEGGEERKKAEVEKVSRKVSDDYLVIEQNNEASQPVNPFSAWDGGEYAASLSGTEIDGHLLLNDNGDLVMSIEVKDFLDYFLSAVGEVSVEEAIETIYQQASIAIPEAAVGQLMTVLENYLAYQHAMQDMMSVPLLAEKRNDYKYYSEVMAQSFEEIKRLRRAHFSPETAEAFFALEERFSEYAVATMQIRADESLTNEEKQQKVQALEDLMPEQMKQAQQEARSTAELASKARRMFDAGESEDLIVGLLSENYDESTVKGMLNFYKKEKIWQDRVDQYMDLKSHLDLTDMNDQEAEVQLDTLRKEYFSEEELVRLLSHEAIERKRNKYQG